MGEVCAARDTRLERTVAIKFSKDAFNERFEREARAVAALNHPNICTLYDIGPNYLVMEFIEGPTLAEIIAGRAQSPVEALQLATQIAQALAAAHRSGIAHRDLKPANIKITRGGVLKVLDFGLAKTLDAAAPADGATASARDATNIGVVLGTVAYMSPEQAEGLPVDHRTDIWSFGIVLYQMLTRHTPFERATTQRTILDILQKPVTPVPGAPRPLARIIEKCLEKDREARYQSADALVADLDACALALNPVGGGVLATLRRSRMTVPAAIALVALTVTSAWLWRRARMEQWARQTAIPEAHRLADSGDYLTAVQLAYAAERYVPRDGALRELWTDISRSVAVQSQPPGADVAWKPYAQPDAEWQPLGTTPVTAFKLPAIPLRLRVNKSGYAPIEVAAAGTQYQFVLAPQSNLSAGMVRVPAGNLRAHYSGIGELTGPVGAFDIDKFEVTNRQFKEFVDKGGYRNRAFWTEPFVENGQTLTWEAAMTRFVDSTGRPGPSTWEAGNYDEGQADDPVTGVSWYEAAAYASFAGKSLPTVYHWFRAANTDDSHFLISFSNFASPRPRPARQSHALGSQGTVDMAGNVREWCWNAGEERRYILGGSHADPSYMLTRGELAPPFDRSSTNGFRLVKKHDSSRAAAMVAMMAPITPTPPPAYLSAPPVSNEVFALYESLYAYERNPLNAAPENMDDGSELYRRERLTFDAGYGGERMIAYLFLPRTATAPVPCVVVMPSGSTLAAKRSGESIRPESYLLRSGRAMLYPIFKGTFERFERAPTYQPIEVRDSVVAWRKDLSRSLDYLETRRDIDMKKVGYFGYSMGSEVAPMLLSMDKRFAAAALLSGGFTPLLGKLPEVNAPNFLPRVRTPVLMVNGRYDSILPVATAQEPFFQQLGTPPADKHRIVVDSGHTVMTPETHKAVIRAVLDWFERYL